MSNSFKRLFYPPAPQKPSDNDCCGSGCNPCVFDIYELDLKKWKQACENVENGVSSNSTATLSEYDFSLFEITEIKSHANNIKLFKFKIPDGNQLPIHCGQHLVARCFVEDGKSMIRPYTPVNKVKQRGYFLIVVKLYTDGLMSKCIAKQWNVGSSVEWRGPFGDFFYKPNMFSSVLMIASGTGITPMIQIIQEILDNEDDMTFISLVYSIKTVSDIIYKDQLHEWSSFWNFNVQYCLTKEKSNQSKMKYGDKIHYVRINKVILGEVLDKRGIMQKRKVLICGSKRFNEDIKTMTLSSFQIEPDDIHCF